MIVLYSTFTKGFQIHFLIRMASRCCHSTESAFCFDSSGIETILMRYVYFIKKHHDSRGVETSLHRRISIYTSERISLVLCIFLISLADTCYINSLIKFCLVVWFTVLIHMGTYIEITMITRYANQEEEDS